MTGPTAGAPGTPISALLEDSVEDLKSVIRAARCRTSRVRGVAQRILDTFPEEN